MTTTKTTEYVVIRETLFYGDEPPHWTLVGELTTDRDAALAFAASQAGPVELGHNEYASTVEAYEVQDEIEPWDWASFPSALEDACVSVLKAAGVDTYNAEAIDTCEINYIDLAAKAIGLAVVQDKDTDRWLLCKPL